jgi:hypothetical protein
MRSVLVWQNSARLGFAPELAISDGSMALMALMAWTRTLRKDHDY